MGGVRSETLESITSRTAAMSRTDDPTVPLRLAAARFSGEPPTAACTQSSFKAGKSAFLFVGPGTKGQGFKAMFKLKASLPEAAKLAAKFPSRFEVGKTGWVTARFSADEPLPEAIWSKWLVESHGLVTGTAGAAKRSKAKRTR